MEKIKLLIDTDIGGDIDDALCVAVALNSAQVDLLGMTTVYAASQWRTDLAKAMLKTWGREDIPVHRGAERPLLGRYPHDQGAEPQENEAVPFIIRTCRENPGLTVLAIGPLTNLALAVHLAPDILKNTRFILMGGMIGSAQPEWNIQCDPEAAAIVVEACRPRMVGLDITEQCRLTREEADRLTQGDDPRLTFLKGEFDRFFGQFTFLPTLHDPLALAGILFDGLIDWEEKDIHVETRGERTRGTTVWNRHARESNVVWGARVNAEEATRRIIAGVRGEGETGDN